MTDIHESSDAAKAAAYVDVLQIPAFLVRQTDLVVAAAKTGKVVNLKKGQFMSAESMKHAVKKVLDSGNNQAMITDRGTMFGYQDMIVDFRGIPVMQQFAPTILDITHSLQQPNQASGVTGGKPELIETIARAGIAVGVDGLFLETHFDPASAKSDGANMLHLDHLEDLMTKLVAIRKTSKWIVAVRCLLFVVIWFNPKLQTTNPKPLPYRFQVGNGLFGIFTIKHKTACQQKH